jgi:hypothetical protein
MALSDHSQHLEYQLKKFENQIKQRSKVPYFGEKVLLLCLFVRKAHNNTSLQREDLILRLPTSAGSPSL